MAVSILEALENAYYNLCEQRIPGLTDVIGKEQLKNAIALLEKGYSAEDEVEPLIDKYGSIEEVPEKTSI